MRPFVGVLLLAVLPACGGSSSAQPPKPQPPEPQPAACTSGRAKDGTFTLAFPSRCMTGVTLRVRESGTFRAAAADDALQITDAGGGALRVVASAPPPVEAFEITLPGVPGDTLLQQGYQSWGYSGVAKIPASVPLGQDGAPALGAAQDGDPVAEVAGVSYGSAVVGTKGGPFFVAGAVSAAVATTGIAVTTRASGSDAGGSEADVAILYGALREPLPAGAGGKVASEPLHLAFATSAEGGLAALATEIGAALPGGPRAPARPPGGWFSWNEHFSAIDEALIQANASVVAQKLAPLGMKLVEIDDGWEVAWGDWTANASFPSGMASIGSYITGKGLVAGVWMAPFLVDVTSAPAKSADPSLFLQGEGGAPLVHQPSGSTKQYYVLDGTNDASMALATKAIEALYAAGFRYFKLDYLYAGALAGGHHASGATGAEALAAGLAKLRAAAGKGGIIDACGAPILPVLGWADALRVGIRHGNLGHRSRVAVRRGSGPEPRRPGVPVAPRVARRGPGAGPVALHDGRGERRRGRRGARRPRLRPRRRPDHARPEPPRDRARPEARRRRLCGRARHARRLLRSARAHPRAREPRGGLLGRDPLGPAAGDLHRSGQERRALHVHVLLGQSARRDHHEGAVTVRARGARRHPPSESPRPTRRAARGGASP